MTISALFAAHTVAAATEHDARLIVFVQDTGTPVDKAFQTQLPQLRSIAEQAKIGFTVINVTQFGAPPEVTITPVIVFQNHAGRSVYQGRTTTLPRVRHFIRTSRVVPQGHETNLRKHIPVWRTGRTQIWAPIKITSLQGATPPAYDPAKFRAEAIAAIQKGFQRFALVERAELGRTDRGFYMDFYPEYGNDEVLSLSTALYSQFHCNEPVYELNEGQLTGNWNDRSRLFREAATLLENAVVHSIGDADRGDGFDVIAADVSSRSWEDLGLALPPPPKETSGMTAASTPKGAELAKTWVVDHDAVPDPPMIQFRFPAPLDQYTGVVTKANAKFELGPRLTISGASGSFEVDPRLVTMGEPDLDDALQGAIFLSTRKYPLARFKIDSIAGDTEKLSFGEITPVNVTGKFLLKGVEVDLTPSMALEPIIGVDGIPRLIISGAFSVNLRNFRIEEADGPAPAKHTLLFDFHFVMKPVAE